MKQFALLASLVFVMMALAGCGDSGSGSSGTTDAVDKDNFLFQSGKGGIAGLLVNDAFRPIDLEETEEDASGQFQFAGFVLLQETGERRLTNSDGEFTFENLEPGTYKLRFVIQGHEATPITVEVVAGEFSSLTIEARRVATDNSFVVSFAYSAFVPCGYNAILVGSVLDCTFDQSGDSSRESFTVDYSGFGNATELIMEMLGNQEEFYDIWVQTPGNQVCSGAYNIDGGPNTRYVRMHFKINEAHPETYATCGNLVWDNLAPMQTIVYLNSLGYEEGVGFGLGVYIGVQANFVHNLYINEPVVNTDTFCSLCPGGSLS